jgi:hypothetical protein
MPDKEVLVTPFLVAFINPFPKRFTGVPRNPVPMHDVIMNRVEGRKVEAAAKPPDRSFIWFFSDKKPYICVGSRHVWIQRMNHQGNPHRVKTASSQFWPVRGCGWRETFTDHMGKIHTGLFNELASTKHSGPASPSSGVRPLVFLKTGGRFFPLET